MSRSALILAVLAIGCSDRARSAEQSGSDLHIAVVTHGLSTDPFWSVVANGVRTAAADLGVRATYASAPPDEMGALIDSAVVSRPNGLILSIPDPERLRGAIQRAVEAGIPIISIHSGSDVYSGIGILTHVGQTEYESGLATGERMAAAGVRRALCVNHAVGNPALDARCRGFSDGILRAQGTVRVLQVNLGTALQQIGDALRADPSVDGLITLGPAGGEAALGAIEGLKASRIRLATFDLSPRMLQAVRDGKALFAVDQQPYLQGYLPIVLLSNYIRTLTLPGGGKVVQTGPVFVTAETAGRVIDLAKRGIR